MNLKPTQKLLFFALLLLAFSRVTAKSTPAIKVDDVTINKESIDSVVDLLSQQQFAGRALSSEERVQLVQMVAGNFLSQELLLKDAKSKKLSVSPAQIDSMMSVFKGSFPSTADYTSALKRVGDNEASLRVKMQRQLLLEKTVGTVVKVLERPDDKTMHEYFAKNKDKFVINNSYRASQILIKVPEKASGAVKDEKQQKLAKLRDILVAETKLDLIIEKFTRLALAHSEDPQAEQGGDLGEFKIGDFFPEFDKQIKKLSVGQISEIFKSPMGFHLVLLTEKNDGTFENSKLKVMQIYVLEKTKENQEKMENYLQSLLKKSKVQYFNDKYKGALSSEFNPGSLK